MSIRLIIACGGTGGHLFPGIAVAEAVIDRGGVPLLITSKKEIDALAMEGHEELKYETLSSIGMPKIYSLKMLKFLKAFYLGYKKSKHIIKDFQADAVLGMGGFTSLPPLIAGHKKNLKNFIHESNAFPGKANRVAARWADHILLGMPSCAIHFKNKQTDIVGTPLRSIMRRRHDRSLALSKFGLKEGKKTILVMGGSQGAQALNSSIVQNLEQIKRAGMQVIHITGPKDYERIKINYENYQDISKVVPFCDEMHLVYTASDLAIIRSGASSLAEISAYSIPAILVPYPYATDDHQTLNAEYYVENGAAHLIKEEDLNADSILSFLDELFKEDGVAYNEMKNSMKKLSVVDSAEKICDKINSLCN
ncbi:MAG: undecaprenyldiphospho-muramoylpentapeptide beta-N-acetylglucosaminyltransferase [Verrucomicrobiota bacterium]|nr:undecaprenyldiphospho-muramoylpentapeptide beta-N-acetylglucosaminyltransferase [Verrucomicrobiota bacterium]